MIVKEQIESSLNLEHTVVLEEYKLLISFSAGLVTGVTLATIYNIPTWYYYSMGAGLVSFFIWKNVGEPLRERLNRIHALVRHLS